MEAVISHYKNPPGVNANRGNMPKLDNPNF